MFVTSYSVTYCMYIPGNRDFVSITIVQFMSSNIIRLFVHNTISLSGEPDYFGRNKISSGGDLSHYSSASLY